MHSCGPWAESCVIPMHRTALSRPAFAAHVLWRVFSTMTKISCSLPKSPADDLACASDRPEALGPPYYRIVPAAECALGARRQRDRRPATQRAVAPRYLGSSRPPAPLHHRPSGAPRSEAIHGLKLTVVRRNRVGKEGWPSGVSTMMTCPKNAQIGTHHSETHHPPTHG